MNQLILYSSIVSELCSLYGLSMNFEHSVWPCFGWEAARWIVGRHICKGTVQVNLRWGKTAQGTWPNSANTTCYVIPGCTRKSPTRPIGSSLIERGAAQHDLLGDPWYCLAVKCWITRLRNPWWEARTTTIFFIHICRGCDWRGH